MMRTVISLLAVCLSIAAVSWAISPYVEKDRSWDFSSDNHCFQRISDTVSDLWLAHSNRMAFGRPQWQNSPFPVDEEQTGSLPYSFEASFPAGSGKEYLYAAGLWVGGVKGQDTLVSHAFDYVAPVPELNPLPCPNGAFQTEAGWADVEHVAVAYDTIVIGDTLYRCQVGDCNDWYPLGIKVTSHSYTWESPPYNRSIIVQYTIRNIDSLPLRSGWAGVYSDCDIGVVPGAYNDDVSAFMNGAFDSLGNWVDLDVAYSYDLDGDPGAYSFADYSTLGAFGVQVLGLSVPDYRVNFNWWAISDQPQYDWAPRQQDFIIRDLGGSYAAAYGDSNKYFVMSYPEVDYPEIEAALPHPGWLTPDDRAVAAAGGSDTRFLISAGPFDLEPQEEVTFTVAFIAGDHVITNAHIDMWYDPSDPLSVSDYYEVLNLQELQASALAAREIFDSGFSLPPPGPPPAFRMIDFDDTYVSLIWSRKIGLDAAGYKVLRSRDNGPWDTAAVNEIDDTAAVISGLDALSEYRFAVVTFDSAGAAGKSSRSVTIIPGLPHAPATLQGSSHRLYPQLDWPPSTDSEVDRYRVYRSDAAISDTIMIAETGDTSYVDHDVSLAHTYDYYITAVSETGLESPPSPSVRLIPMAMDAGILAVNNNPGAISSNLLFTKAFLDSLIFRALDGLTYTYRLAGPEDSLTLEELANYSLVIISSENRAGSVRDNLDDLLPQYLANGGRVILLLRHVGIEQSPVSDPFVLRFEENSFISHYLMIDSSYIGPLTVLPGYQIQGDLVGATPETADLPALTWDSVRINQFGYRVPNGIPYAGYFWPHSPAEVMYRYRSAVPDSVIDGQVNGIRYKGDDYSFYLLNFPPSLMEIDSAAAMLRAAAVNLGGYYICGDVNEDTHFNIGDIVNMIHYLYEGAEVPGIYPAGDVDCDGNVGMPDVVMLIDFLFKGGLAPECCP